MSLQAEVEVVTLASLKDGAAMEQFDEQLKKVVDNILDVNTEPTKAREVNLKVTIKPDKGRGSAVVTIAASAKLAPEHSVDTVIYMARRNGVAQATEYNPRQARLYDDNVTPIDKGIDKGGA